MTFGSRQLAFLPAAVGLVCLCGCGMLKTAPLDVWCVSAMVNLTDKTPPFADPLVYDAQPPKVSLFAAANETVSFQLVVDAGDEPVRALRVAASDLTPPAGEKIPCCEWSSRFHHRDSDIS